MKMTACMRQAEEGTSWCGTKLKEATHKIDGRILGIVFVSRKFSARARAHNAPRGAHLSFDNRQFAFNDRCL
jgi:hypothetical protein